MYHAAVDWYSTSRSWTLFGSCEHQGVISCFRIGYLVSRPRGLTDSQSESCTVTMGIHFLDHADAASIDNRALGGSSRTREQLSAQP
jgi:hypothetical protein